MLSCGLNKLELTYICNDFQEHTHTVEVNYVPLLQYPPLHLAVLVASDSPCLIDCPPYKAGGLSSAHSDLNAAMAKLRMTAYMWQAMTAEDMRMKGLGRRSFRLDEEWTADTVSKDFYNAGFDGALDAEGAMRSTAKVHQIHSSKTVKEIRDENVAQQNSSASRRDDLFDYFKNDLKEKGESFASSGRPIVAGLILDSHYNISKDMILGHAALGGHDPKGISLGIFGSHLTYSWPRFLEEVTACLTDTRAPGDKVGDDNGECSSMWEACTIGQGAMLHEVGHAFGSPHRPGIMERGYAQDWPKHFLPKTAYCRRHNKDGVLVDETTPNGARWNLADALSFWMLPHFRLPTDPALTAEQRKEAPSARALFSGAEEENIPTTLSVSSPCGIARISFDDKPESVPSISSLQSRDPAAMFRRAEIHYSESELERRFDRSQPLSMQVLGLNGKEYAVKNVWKLLATSSFIRIPGSNFRLSKRSVGSENQEESEYYEWAQLLREKGPEGNIHRATSIDLRVGCLWDGGVVKYADGHKSHWGPMRRNGYEHHFGGHASEEISIPVGVEIKYIEVNNNSGHCMGGVRMHLSNGTSAGELNGSPDDEWSDIQRLEPGPDEVIVGFYGKNEKRSFCGVVEFGILTAPRKVGIEGLPAAAFDMAELKNTEGLDGEDNDVRGQSPNKRLRSH